MSGLNAAIALDDGRSLTCSKCTLAAEVVRVAGVNELSLPAHFFVRCPYLAEKLRQAGRLEPTELDCPHLTAAAAKFISAGELA